MKTNCEMKQILAIFLKYDAYNLILRRKSLIFSRYSKFCVFFVYLFQKVWLLILVKKSVFII